MVKYLIKDTTREERERIVAESLGNIDASCDGCSSGIVEMYQDYIDGKKELREISMEFNARYISGEEAPEVEGYESVRVVAWSMGVWAASVLLSRWNIPVSYRVAINGTERPVDEHYGIHPKIYLLTERGMTEQGRDKFFARMLSGKEEIERFEENKPCRDIDEQRDELRLIREQSVREMSEMHWDRVYISEGDVIFPVENQRNWWRDRVEIITLSGGHYPFYVLDNWEKIWK